MNSFVNLSFIIFGTSFKNSSNERYLSRTKSTMGVIRRNDSDSSQQANSFQSGMIGLGFGLVFLMSISFFMTRDYLRADTKLPKPIFPKRRWRRALVAVAMWLGILVLLVLMLALTPLWILLGARRLFRYCNEDIDVEAGEAPAAGPANATTAVSEPADAEGGDGQAAEHKTKPNEPAASDAATEAAPVVSQTSAVPSKPPPAYQP